MTISSWQSRTSEGRRKTYTWSDGIRTRNRQFMSRSLVRTVATSGPHFRTTCPPHWATHSSKKGEWSPPVSPRARTIPLLQSLCPQNMSSVSKHELLLSLSVFLHWLVSLFTLPAHDCWFRFLYLTPSLVHILSRLLSCGNMNTLCKYVYKKYLSWSDSLEITFKISC